MAGEHNTRVSPGPAGAGPLEEADDDTEIRRELLLTMLSQTRTALAGNLAIGFTSAAVLWGSGLRAGVLPWIVAIVLMVLLRGWHSRRLRPRVPALPSSGITQAERQYVALLAINGGLWGVLPWISYTGQTPVVDFFSVAMLVGMTAGAATSAAPIPRALQAYVVAAFTPFIVKSALIGELVYLAGGLTIVFSMVVLMAFGHSTYRGLRQTLLVTRQNLRLAEALRRERDAVQATMRAKDLFLAGVTHDLRQPVHALSLHLRYLRQLRADELSPQAVDTLVAPMDTAMHAMSRQLTRLLELSRLEAGAARVTRRPLTLAEVFTAVRAQFEPLARERGLELRLRPGSGAIDSDPHLLMSIVENLVSNALRYTTRGGVLLVAQRRGAWCRLAVFDTGPGIEAALLPQLFIAYRRFDDRNRSGDEGQGLGLALVKKQAELLGHPLHVRSVPGRGSCFAVSVLWQA